MQSISYKKRKVSFTIEGSGFPLVLIHGFCEDSRVWDNLSPELEKFQLIKIDLPGFGFSEVLEDLSIEYFADVIKAVLDHLSIQKCILVGHSMGGYSTLAFAEFYPDYLRGFGIFHSHPFEDSEEGKEKRQKSIDFILKNGTIHYVKQLIPKLFPPSFISSKRYLVDRLVFNASKYKERGILGGLIAMRNRPDRSHVLRNAKVPVLFILGKKDDLIPFEKQVEQCHFPDISTVHLLANVGHMGPLEAPKKTGIAIRKFCDFCLD